MERYYLSVVVPAYNEGKSIERSMGILFKELDRISEDYEVIVVNDGSRDDTLEQLIKLKSDYKNLKIISYKTNRGKGHAIHRGLSAVRGKYCAVIDADMEIHPVQILKYLDILKENSLSDSGVTGVTGCKFDPDSNVNFPFYRRVMSVCYYKMLHVMFTFDIRDTNTGLKVFITDKLTPLLNLLSVDGFAYDVELLSAIYDNGGRMIAAPVVCAYSRDDRRINVKNVAMTFLDTMDVFMKDIRGKYKL